MQQNTNNNEVHLHQGRFGLSLLNGMIGEYLEKENNPLSVQMGFYHRSSKLNLNDALETQVDFPLTNKVVIFVHGLTNLENVWDYPPDDGTTSSIVSHYIDVFLDSAAPIVEQSYGTKLQAEHGFTPLFLRYNSGLSLEKNGRNFSTLINKLVDKYPIKIEEIVLIGYGMGGQVISHAQYAADKSSATWLHSLSRCLYLGNIYESSILSMILKLGSILMRQMPFYYNHQIADWLDQRSKQVQTDSQLNTQNRLANTANPVSLFLEDKRHFFINCGLKPEYASSLSSNSVHVPQAAPLHSQNAYVEGISPMRLCYSDQIYNLLANWINGDSAPEIKLQTHSSELHYPIQEVVFDGYASNDATHNIFLAGTVDLMASAYDKTVEAIETMHYSLTDEPLQALDKVPLVSQMAKSLEGAQREMLDSFYSNLRSRGKKMHKFAAEIA